MTIGDALHEFLKTSLAAQVGTKIYSFTMPQGTDPPALTFQQTSGVPIRSHEGTDQLKRPVFSFSCWGDTIEQAWEVAAALQSALGSVTTMGPFMIQNIAQLNELEDEGINQDATIKKYRIIADYQIYYK